MTVPDLGRFSIAVLGGGTLLPLRPLLRTSRVTVENM